MPIIQHYNGSSLASFQFKLEGNKNIYLFLLFNLLHRVHQFRDCRNKKQIYNYLHDDFLFQ